MRLKVTVMTPAVAQAAGFVPPNPQVFGEWGAYVVLAPDGAFYGPTWDWACTVAHAYITAGIVQDVSYL